MTGRRTELEGFNAQRLKAKSFSAKENEKDWQVVEEIISNYRIHLGLKRSQHPLSMSAFDVCSFEAAVFLSRPLLPRCMSFDKPTRRDEAKSHRSQNLDFRLKLRAKQRAVSMHV